MDKKNLEDTTEETFQLDIIRDVLKKYDVSLLEFTSNLIGLVLKIHLEDKQMLQKIASKHKYLDTIILFTKIITAFFELENYRHEK